MNVDCRICVLNDFARTLVCCLTQSVYPQGYTCYSFVFYYFRVGQCLKIIVQEPKLSRCIGGLYLSAIAERLVVFVLFCFMSIIVILHPSTSLLLLSELWKTRMFNCMSPLFFLGLIFLSSSFYLFGIQEAHCNSFVNFIEPTIVRWRGGSVGSALVFLISDLLSRRPGFNSRSGHSVWLCGLHFTTKVELWPTLTPHPCAPTWANSALHP